MNDLKARGLADILIAVVDGLGGFPEAIEAAYPQTLVQTCIVHLIRNSMAYGSWKERKRIAAALKAAAQTSGSPGLSLLPCRERGDRPPLINARPETVDAKPAFRSAI